MAIHDSVYWDDLAEDLNDPEFLREYVLESIRIHTVDSIINRINNAREEAGLSKADLARTMSTQPATIRRLLGTASPSNPTLGTLSELAATLGFRVKLERMPVDSSLVSSALVLGKTEEPRRLLEAVEAMKQSDEDVYA